MSAAEAMRADPKLQSKWQDLEVDIAAAMQRFPDQLGDLDIEALNPSAPPRPSGASSPSASKERAEGRRGRCRLKKHHRWKQRKKRKKSSREIRQQRDSTRDERAGENARTMAHVAGRANRISISNLISWGICICICMCICIWRAHAPLRTRTPRITFLVLLFEPKETTTIQLKTTKNPRTTQINSAK